ncbi:MAG: glutathione S-transferase family protein [Burkholderiales bacterium]
MYTLVIGNKKYSSWSLRPWLYLKERGIPFEEICVPLYQGDYKAQLRAHAPTGKVPVLIDGAIHVWETLAILEYLAERHPKTQAWPIDPSARAHARSIASEMHANFHALRTYCTMNVLKTFLAKAWPADAMADIERIDAMWTDCRARFGAGGAFLCGHFGAVDAMFAPVVWRFHAYALPRGPVTDAYIQSMLSLQGMRAWQAGAAAETEVLPQFEFKG